MNGAEAIAEQLLLAGVRDVFGVGGANIEDLFAAVQRRRPSLQATLCKHEHNAGTAADAYARVSGRVGVVMVTSGGGAMNLVPALAEAYQSEVPVLAFVGEPPTALQGRGAFQDTSGKGGVVDAARVLREVSRHCVRATSADTLPNLIRQAIAQAMAAPRGPAVLLVAKDLQQAAVTTTARDETPPPIAGATGAVSADTLHRALGALQARPIIVVAGAAVARQQSIDALLRFSDAFDAQICLTPDGKDAFDNRNARCLGVIGAMGHAKVESALREAGVVVLAGTRLPLLARMGLEPLLQAKSLVSMTDEPPFVTSADSIRLGSNLHDWLTALADAAPTSTARAVFGTPRAAPVAGESRAPDARLGLCSALQTVASMLQDRGIVLVDAGNTGAASVHHVLCPRAGRWLIAMGMAGMGYTFGAAIGAARASGERCTVLTGDGAFFMHGLEIHTAMEHQLPITYVILDNRAHGMCLVREHLLLRDNAGYNSFRPAHLAQGLGAMFPGLLAQTCRTEGELSTALQGSRHHTGPLVISVELEEVEVPPFTAFMGAIERGLSSVSRSRAP